MTHYHADVTSMGEARLFQHEWQAKAYLASYYVDLATLSLEHLSDDDDHVKLETECFQSFLREAMNIFDTEGTETTDGREWEDEGGNEWAWFDRCEKDECYRRILKSIVA